MQFLMKSRVLFSSHQEWGKAFVKILFCPLYKIYSLPEVDNSLGEQGKEPRGHPHKESHQ